MKKLLAYTCLIFSCHACIDSDQDLPTAEPVAVLNCIINNEDQVQVELLESKSYADDGDYPAISNAKLELFENDSLVTDNFRFEDEVYLSNFIPRVEANYRIVVFLPNGTILKAETSIPSPCSPQLLSISRSADQSEVNVSAKLDGTLPKNAKIRFKAEYHYCSEQSTGFKLCSASNASQYAAVETPPLYYDRLGVYFLENLEGDFRFSLNALPISTNALHDSVQVEVDVWSQELTDYFEFIKNGGQIGSSGDPYQVQATTYSNVQGGTGIFAGKSIRHNFILNRL